MDTLRLAIDYIQFLKEIIETTQLDEELEGERKVIICCSQQVPACDTAMQVTGHSLSWRKGNIRTDNKVVTSSIWIPAPGEISPDD